MANENMVRSEHSFRVAAQEYVNTQLEMMEKYGAARPLSVDEYSRLVTELKRVGERMWIASGGAVEYERVTHESS